MNIKSFIAAAALMLAATSSAFASVITLTQSTTDPTQYTGGFTVSHVAAFTDTYTFTPDVGTSLVSASLISIGLASHNINFTSVTLNGQALDIINGYVDTAATSADLLLHGVLTLVVSGTSGANASYSGTINVTAVPEPETYGMLLGGLGLLGVVARRRKAANQA